MEKIPRDVSLAIYLMQAIDRFYQDEPKNSIEILRAVEALRFDYTESLIAAHDLRGAWRPNPPL